MLNKTTTRTKIVTLALVAVAVTAAWAETATTLRYKGDVVSHGIRVIDGRPYVPLNDVARIVHGSVVRTGAGYEIQIKSGDTSAGGADQVNGLNGSIGHMLFTGKWRFEVTGVTRTGQYTTQYEPTTETVGPTGGNDEVVVVSCVVKNAQPQPRQLVLRIGNVYNTALTDDQGQSYPPNHFDFSGGSGYGPTMLPGSTQHFNALFSVPKGTKLKDLVFTLYSIEDTKTTDVRFSLAQ